MADEEVVEQTEELNVGTSNSTDEDDPLTPTPYITSVVKEVAGSRQIRINNNGCSGTYTLRGFPYKWFAENTVPNPLGGDDLPFFGTIVPFQNTPWDETYWYLKLADVEVREIENGYGEATCNYTSEGRVPTLNIADGAQSHDYSLKSTVSFGSQTHKISGDCKWAVNTPAFAESVPNPYVDSLDFVDGYMDYSLEFQQNYSASLGYNLENFVAYAKGASLAYNAINSIQWHSFPAQSMLCTNLSCEPMFSFDGHLIAIITRADFKIFCDLHSHNKLWKEPTPLPDSQGNDIVWHNIPNQPYPYNQFYTTDIYKVGTKVYVDDVTMTVDPVTGLLSVTPVTPTPVHGGWVAPYYERAETRPGLTGYFQYYIHNEVDFTTVLSIPRFSNDPTPD